MRIPGPSDLFNAAEWVGSTVENATSLVPRVVALLDAAEHLVERINQIVDRAELAVGRVDDTLVRVDDVVSGAESAVARADGVLTKAADATSAAGGVLTAAAAATARADSTVEDASSTLGKASKMLDEFEPPLTQLKPVLDRLAETTNPDEVAAVVRMIDMLPELTESMRTDILPLLKTLDTVGPDIHDMLMVSKELNEMLGSLPGMGRIKKRVEEEQAEEAASDN